MCSRLLLVRRFPTIYGCTILDMKEVPEWKWKPAPDEELAVEQNASVLAGAKRPEMWLVCVRWVLRGFKDKRHLRRDT